MYPEPQSYCHTCARLRLDADIRACTRPYCTGKSALERAPVEVRPPVPNYEPPVYVDPWKGAHVDIVSHDEHGA